MNFLLELKPEEVRNEILELIYYEEKLLGFLECIYDDIDKYVRDEELNPKELYNVYINARLLITQLKVVIKECPYKIPVRLKMKMSMINQEVFCTSLVEIKKEAERFVSNDDIKEIIFKTEAMEVIEKWMINQGANNEWLKIQEAIYNKFIPAAKEMRRRYPVQSRIEKLDRGYHNFSVTDIKKLDGDLILPIVRDFHAEATDDNTMLVSFGKWISIRTIYHNYSSDTILEQPEVVKYDDNATGLLESIEYISSLKFSDYLAKNPKDCRMEILVKNLHGNFKNRQ